MVISEVLCRHPQLGNGIDPAELALDPQTRTVLQYRRWDMGGYSLLEEKPV
jgi:hypothetical protein